MDPKPNPRYMIGYGSWRISFLNHFSDSLLDYIVERMFWKKDVKK